jgi:hypothetical protein
MLSVGVSIAEGSLGIDPEDPEGSINSVRRANVILSGKFMKDKEKTDSIGRTYPYWFVIQDQQVP